MQKIIELYKLEQQIHQAKNQNDLPTALELYNRVIQIKQEVSNRLGIARTCAEKGFLLEKSGYITEAVKMFKFAAQIAGDSPNQQFVEILQQKLDEISKK